MLDYQWVEEGLLKHAATEKIFQPAWQAQRYLLGTKMFAYVGIHEPSKRPILTLKLEPMFSDMLRREYPDIVPGYYMNKVHWSTIYLDGAVPKTVILDLVHASYQVAYAALSKKAQRSLLVE